jgi:predicted membrane protein
MNQLSSLPGFNRIAPFRVSQTDLVRFWVIVSITIAIIGITYISTAAGYGAIVPQLYYFPILYTTYFYPKRGMYVACSCAAAYLVIAAAFIVPNPMNIAGIIFQALLFIGIAAGTRYVLKSRELSTVTAPDIESDAILAMIKTGEGGHIEFKFSTLWSADLTIEEVNASESAELRKYRNNASKFIIARSIAGFLNTDGGDLMIGIREDRTHNSIDIVGIGDDYLKLHEESRNPDGYRRMLVDSIVRKYLPEIFDTMGRFIDISFPVVSGRTICHLHILPSDKPIFVDTGNEEHFFIRVDASTRSITGKTLTRYTLTRFAKY